jgi:hypothetical protein
MKKERALEYVIDAMYALQDYQNMKELRDELENIARRLRSDINGQKSDLFEMCKSTADLQKKMRGES